MRRILVPLVALLLAGSTLTGLSQVLASSGPGTSYPGCANGVLATDPPGDTEYPPFDVDELEDPALDLLEVRAQPIDAGSFALTLKVADIADHDPPSGTHALYSLLLAGDGEGDPVEVQIHRSNTTSEESGTIGDEPFPYRLDTEANEVHALLPRAALGEGATVVAVMEATSASSVLVGGPIIDRLSGGSCVVALDGSSEPAQQPGPTGNDLVRSPDRGSSDSVEGPTPVAFDPTRATIAVIDSGLHAAHQEFDFDETRNEPNGQLTAWWDFSGANTTDKTPDLWFEDRAPYDPGASGSHGTGTSAMAVGRNLSPGKTPSACPGCRLAFAKVLNESDDDAIDGDIAHAIRWAVDVAKADVISMSIGAAIPLPEAVVDLHEAAGYARSKGVLMVVSNGNGWGNAGIPGQPGGITPYGNSTNVLSVGAAEVPEAYQVSTDPEVTARFNVFTAENTGGYHEISGTSFSAPFVAGAAGRLVAEAKACSAPYSPEWIQRLLEVTAKDTTTPPAFEGYGTVDLETVGAAIEVVCGRAEAPTPDPVTEAYVEKVSGTERRVWTEGLAEAGSQVTLHPTPVKGVTPQGVIGASAPSGAADAEIYELTIPGGAVLDAEIRYGGSALRGAGVSDVDVYLYRADGAGYTTANFLTLSAEPGDVDERLVYANYAADPLTVRLAIVGWSVVVNQPFTLTGMDGAALVFDGYTLGDHLHLVS